MSELQIWVHQIVILLTAVLFHSPENMRSELLRVQQEEMQKLHREFEVQLASMKLQLQRANELRSKDVSSIVRMLNSCLGVLQYFELDEEMGE